MELNAEYLKNSIKSLESQYKELVHDRDLVNGKINAVKGALRWIKQTLELMEKPRE